MLYSVVVCQYNGHTYNVGFTQIPKGDGCNYCTCLANGQVDCTDNATCK